MCWKRLLNLTNWTQGKSKDWESNDWEKDRENRNRT